MNFRLILTVACIALITFVSSAATGQDETSGTTARTEGTTLSLGTIFGDIEGTFVLLDSETSHVITVNPERANTRFVPASTFKIPNSLIALDSGVAPGPEFPLPYNSARNPRKDWWPKEWAKDQTLGGALKHSVVWYYQEIARRVGPERMQKYLTQFDYGNRDISGGIDQFWLSGGLRISAREQVEFLRKFYFDELGVSTTATLAVKEIMVLEKTAGYTLGGKTGWGNMGEEGVPQVGWLVGYLKCGDKVYLYATNIRVEKDEDAKQRLPITKEILGQLGLLP